MQQILANHDTPGDLLVHQISRLRFITKQWRFSDEFSDVRLSTRLQLPFICTKDGKDGKVQLTDQTFWVLSESYALWRETSVLYYGGEQMPCWIFCRGVYASNDGLHRLFGYTLLTLGICGLLCAKNCMCMFPKQPDQNWPISEQKVWLDKVLSTKLLYDSLI